MSDEVAITLITSLTSIATAVLTVVSRRISQNTAALDAMRAEFVLLRAAVLGESVGVERAE